MAVVEQLSLFFLDAVVLVLISAHLIMFNYVVKFCSRLDDAETLNTYWAKVRYHVMVPHRAAIVLCIITGVGISNLVRSILTTLLQFGDLLSVNQDLSFTGEYFVSCVSTCIGAAAGTALYTIERGEKLRTFLVFQTVMLLASDLVKLFAHTEVSWFAWLLWIVSFVTISVTSITFFQKHREVFDDFLYPPPEESILEEAQSMKPKIDKKAMCRELGLAMLGILAYVMLNYIHVLILNFASQEKYAHFRLATLLVNLTELLPLFGCGLLVVYNLNNYIRAKATLYNWVWVIFSIVNCCVVYQNMFETFFRDLKKNETMMEVLITQILRNYFTYYAFGLFCGVIYLGTCLRSVDETLGTDVENAGELVVLDEDEDEGSVEGADTPHNA